MARPDEFTAKQATTLDQAIVMDERKGEGRVARSAPSPSGAWLQIELVNAAVKTARPTLQQNEGHRRRPRRSAHEPAPPKSYR